MPNRVIREGMIESEKINLLTNQAEIFFIRLMLKADDYGRYHAHTGLLKANLFPLKLDTIREADISRWIAECEKAGLIALFEENNKRYIEIINFDQRLRIKKSKFPAPQSYVRQMSDTRQPVVESESETETEKKKNIAPNPTARHVSKPVNIKSETKPRLGWKAYIDAFCVKIGKKKGLSGPYKPTGKEIKCLASLYDQFTPEVVMACWEMAWETDRPWSSWGAQNGRSIEWFSQPRTILTIMDDQRYKIKADKIRSMMGFDANSSMGAIRNTIFADSIVKTQVG